MTTETTVIYHKSDFDGIFCREIARKFLPHADLIGWEYGEPEPKVPENHRLYILDLSVPGLMSHPKLIWIDHHKSAMEKYPSTIPGYRIDGVAACRLAWHWFVCQPAWQKPEELASKQHFVERLVLEPLAVRLAGEYDVWDKRDPDAEVFQFGLKSSDLKESDWKELLSMEPVEGLKDTGMDMSSSHLAVSNLLQSGYILQRYQRQSDTKMMERSFLFYFEGLTFLALNTALCNSLTFASKDNPETGHDALMGLHYNGRKWSISLYHAKHRTDIDLSKIAVKYGGGGHRGACGFQIENMFGSALYDPDSHGNQACY